MEAGRDTGHEHRGVSVLYPDGTLIHRDTHGSEVAHEHYKRLHTEHVTKNHAYALIVDALPAKYKKAVLDSDGDPILDDNGQPGLTIKDKHKPRFKHLGAGRYEFALPGVDDSTTGELAVQLSQEFGDRIVLLRPAS